MWMLARLGRLLACFVGPRRSLLSSSQDPSTILGRAQGFCCNLLREGFDFGTALPYQTICDVRSVTSSIERPPMTLEPH
ncbi:hypothetical protein AUEXF2481DRAFT_326644 [Aureobasidium subglaciale EXF-2481]|uniref:Secreted protein n=1 Tax=Aureobasidium subglaciale (strain EXF-2481) TaxID=1043005 RepID=A0A074Y6Z1_AURSE|nr:uncharacterized protein AUEXF2481DRAFT_326644 [Aureobasidium subglaciale EXF-2481]KEQ93553.1 hypothetical protein AUEXF2481DRAFT_326644 [Aureobasidium subglaciale EXF-2481]